MTTNLIPTRRFFLAGAGGLLTAGSAFGQIPAAPAAAGQPMIDVDHAQTDPIRIAIPSLGLSPAAAGVNAVITADLTSCGLFRPIDPAAFISVNDANSAAPNFANWKAIGAQALVTGNVTEIGGGQVRVEFRLWDVLTGQQLQGTAYTSPNPRRIAHIMADVIYERMLGEKGYFDTRIVYVAQTGPRGRQTKRLAIMDQDAYNNRVLTNGDWLVLTPRFNPARDQIRLHELRQRSPPRAAVRPHQRPAIHARRIRGHELRAALLARWRQLHPLGHARQRLGYLCRRRRQPRQPPADQFGLDRHQPLLQPRWQPDRLPIRTARATSNSTSWALAAVRPNASATATASTPRRSGRRAAT